MVLKPSGTVTDDSAVFESDVISDGTQTVHVAWKVDTLFESDVISDGTQTCS